LQFSRSTKARFLFLRAVSLGFSFWGYRIRMSKIRLARMASIKASLGSVAFDT